MTDSIDLKITTRSQMAYIQKSFSKLTRFLEFNEVVNFRKKYILQTDLKEKILDWS